VSEGGNYNCIHTLKDHTTEDILTSTMANNTRTVSSLDEVNVVLQEMGINAIAKANQVEFRLHEQTSLQNAMNLKAKVRPGRRGFKLLNPELLECKYKAMFKVQETFNTMLQTCMAECDLQMHPLEVQIVNLNQLLLSTDAQIPHVGPPREERNRGVQQNIYPNPPFPEDPSFEFAPGNQRVPYQTAFATNEELDAAIYRDKGAQRAFWRTNLRLLERKKSILEKKKIDLEKSLRAEFCQVIEEQSDLGVGYANFTI